MLARIWWKEWRTLAPIAAVVAGSAVVIQGFLLYYGVRDIRRGGILVPLGFGWAMLYAFVAGSSSFAGERENRTLGLLDALPVDRRTLWLGKATFALASSLVLTILLSLNGVAGTAREGLGPGSHLVELFAGGGLLIEAVALGLFWSACCRNALTAGALTVLGMGMTVIAIERWLPIQPMFNDRGLHGPGLVSWGAVLGHLALIGATLGASRWVVVREVSPRASRRWSFAFASRPIHLRPAVLDRGPRLALLPSAAFGRVVWQTIRDGRSTWLGTVVLAFVASVFFLVVDPGGVDPGVSTVGLVMLAFMIQGASIFGLENAAGTRPFLDNMAVPPRTVWAAKMAAWVLGWAAFLGVALGLSAVASVAQGRGLFLLGPRGDINRDALMLAAAGNAVAAGMVAGMALNRRITATLVAMLAWFALIIPQFAVVGAHLAPAWGLAIVPTILVAATFFWAGDWLAVRPGWRRWARLAGLVGVPIGVTALAYAGYRAWSVPDVGPQFDVAANRGPSALAGDYRRINDALAADGSPFAPAVDRPTEGVIPRTTPDRDARRDIRVIPWATQGRDGDRAIRDHLAANEATIAEVRRLAANPDAAWFGPARSILDAPAADDWDRTLQSLLWHLGQEAAGRRARGDVAGAWDDILAQVQLVDLYARGAPSVGQYGYAMVKSDWAGQALAWATDPRTPLAAIRAARAALAAVGEPPGIAEAIRAGSWRIERDLDRPTDDWVEHLAPPDRSGGGTPWDRIANSWLTAPSWERERARRVLRLAAAAALRDATLPRGQRAIHSDREWSSGGQSALRTPLAQSLLREVFGADDARDRELANRRALVVFLALRSWQLTHDGVAPATLDQLVPAELAAVPVDPYSRTGGPFGYGPVESPDGFRDASGVVTDPVNPPAPFSTFVLGSVGPDGIMIGVEEDGSRRGHEGVPSGTRWVPTADDLTYPLPPNPAAATPPAEAAPRPVEPAPSPTSPG